MLALLDGYTRARWSELVALEPHEYDEVNRAVPVRAPLRESGGKLVYTDLVAESEGGWVLTVAGCCVGEPPVPGPAGLHVQRGTSHPSHLAG